VLRKCKVQLDSLNPQVGIQGVGCILRVSKSTPDQVVLSVFSHRTGNWDSVVLKAGTEFSFTHGRWKVGDEHCAHRMRRRLLLHWPVLLGHRLVLVDGLVVERNRLVSGHGLSRHLHWRRGRRRHWSLPSDSPLRASSVRVAGRTPPCLLLLLSL